MYRIVVLRGNYFMKQEKSQINNLMLSLGKLEKEEQTKPKINEGNNIRAEINEIEIKDNRKINETKNWFFENINKIDKPLAKFR